MVGEGVSGVYILAEEQREFLMILLIVNCQMKVMKGDKNRSSQDSQL